MVTWKHGNMETRNLTKEMDVAKSTINLRTYRRLLEEVKSFLLSIKLFIEH